MMYTVLRMRIKPTARFLVGAMFEVTSRPAQLLSGILYQIPEVPHE